MIGQIKCKGIILIAALLISIPTMGCAQSDYYGISLKPVADIQPTKIQSLASRAKSGDRQAQLELGVYFEWGYRVPRNINIARQLYKSAATEKRVKQTIFIPDGDIIKSETIDTGKISQGLAEAKTRLEALDRKDRFPHQTGDLNTDVWLLPQEERVLNTINSVSSENKNAGAMRYIGSGVVGGRFSHETSSESFGKISHDANGENKKVTGKSKVCSQMELYLKQAYPDDYIYSCRTSTIEVLNFHDPNDNFVYEIINWMSFSAFKEECGFTNACANSEPFVFKGYHFGFDETSRHQCAYYVYHAFQFNDGSVRRILSRLDYRYYAPDKYKTFRWRSYYYDTWRNYVLGVGFTKEQWQLCPEMKLNDIEYEEEIITDIGF